MLYGGFSKTIIIVPIGAILVCLWFIARYIGEKQYKKRRGIDVYAERDVYEAYSYYIKGRIGEFICCMDRACDNDSSSAWNFLFKELAADKSAMREMAGKYISHSGKYHDEAKKYL